MGVDRDVRNSGSGSGTRRLNDMAQTIQSAQLNQTEYVVVVDVGVVERPPRPVQVPAV